MKSGARHTIRVVTAGWVIVLTSLGLAGFAQAQAAQVPPTPVEVTIDDSSSVLSQAADWAAALGLIVAGSGFVWNISSSISERQRRRREQQIRFFLEVEEVRRRLSATILNLDPDAEASEGATGVRSVELRGLASKTAVLKTLFSTLEDLGDGDSAAVLDKAIDDIDVALAELATTYDRLTTASSLVRSGGSDGIDLGSFAAAVDKPKQGTHDALDNLREATTTWAVKSGVVTNTTALHRLDPETQP